MDAGRDAGGEIALATYRVLTFLRLLVGGVFIYAGFAKAASPQPFAESIAAFDLAPVAWSNVLALSLPPLESLIGGLLLSGWRTRTAAFCALVLTIIFLIAIVSAIIRGLPVDCGCFGFSASRLSPAIRLWIDLGRDVLLLAATLAIYANALLAPQKHRHSGRT